MTREEAIAKALRYAEKAATATARNSNRDAGNQESLAAAAISSSYSMLAPLLPTKAEVEEKEGWGLRPLLPL